MAGIDMASISDLGLINTCEQGRYQTKKSSLRRQPGWDEAQALLDWANSQADSPASFPGDSGR